MMLVKLFDLIKISIENDFENDSKQKNIGGGK